MVPRVPLTRLEKSVCELEAKPVRQGGVLFFGDSLFTRWRMPEYCDTLLEDALKGVPGAEVVVNHGIGGATAEELLYYYPRLVRPYAPKALVLSAYGNDMLFTYSATEVMALLSRVLEYARVEFPGIKLFLCDVKVDTWHIGPEEKFSRWIHGRDEFNHMLDQYAADHPDTQIIKSLHYPGFYSNPEDIGDYNKPRLDLFVEDGIHFTREGYELCGQFFREYFADKL